MKTCSQCGQEKNLGAFYKGRNQCKECVNEKERQWHQQNKANRNEHQRRRYRNRTAEQKATQKQQQKERYAKNKEYYSARHKEWRESNKDQQKLRALSIKYCMEESSIIELFQRSQGRCAICSREAKLVVDHCHKTGVVRALLCGKCNKGIGMFDDSPGILAAAITYLNIHGR